MEFGSDSSAVMWMKPAEANGCFTDLLDVIFLESRLMPNLPASVANRTISGLSDGMIRIGTPPFVGSP